MHTILLLYRHWLQQYYAWYMFNIVLLTVVSQSCRRDYLLERAEDFLVADDPAMYSDEFSEPEEWAFS